MKRYNWDDEEFAGNHSYLRRRPRVDRDEELDDPRREDARAHNSELAKEEITK